MPPSILIEVKCLQPENAATSTHVTLSGIVMEVTLSQPPKAFFPIDVTLWGIIVPPQPITRVFVAVSIIALQSCLESYFVFPSPTMMEVKASQYIKAEPPIVVTPFPMITEVRPLQDEKASTPMLVTLFGMSIEESVSQQ